MSVVLVGPGADDDFEQLLNQPELRRLVREVESEVGELRLTRASSTSSTEFTDEVPAADALLLLGRLEPAALRNARRLRLVSVAATGHEFFLDGEVARERGVRVAYVPAYGVDAVAEHTLALLLAASKNLLLLHLAVRRGEWPQPVSLQVAGSTAGVVGLGPIGRRVVDLLEALGARVLVWTRDPTPDRLAGTRATYASLEEIFEAADLVSLHASHTPQTHGLISDALLQLARPGMVLVNTARAGLIEPHVLERHVGERRIRAAVDVLHEEPPSPAARLSWPDDFLVTPHVGYNTVPALAGLIEGALVNLVLHARGQPLRNEAHLG